MNEQELENAIRSVRSDVRRRFHTGDEIINLNENGDVIYTPRVEISYLEEANAEIARELSAKVEVVKEEPKVEEEMIEDRRGNTFHLPLAKFKESYIYCDETGEDNDDECVKLTILEQKERDFNFAVLITKDEEILINPTGYYSREYELFVGSSYTSVFVTNREYGELYLKGSKDFENENVEVDIPSRYYDKVKKCLEALKCEFIVDEENPKREKAEEEIKKVKYLYSTEPTEEEVEKMISLVDLDTFNNIIRARLIQEGGAGKVRSITKTWAMKYLRSWAYNKYRFFKMFGDKLTLETDIKVENNDEEIRRKVVELKGKLPLYRSILDNINTRAFVFNKIISEHGEYFVPSDWFEDTKVKKDMSLTHFLSLYGSKDLDTEVSKIYQNSGKAHLTISINPIDYLTVSINKSGWKSCHNFFDGCYRNAGLSYMFDEVTMVSYRSSGNDVDYLMSGKKFKWNSKNWRQMIYMDKDSSTTVFSRQYPNDNEQIAKGMRKLFEDSMSAFFKGSNKYKVFNHQDTANVEVYGNGVAYNDVAEGYGHRVIRAKDDEYFDDDVEISIGNGFNSISGNDYIEDGEDPIW